VSIEEEQFLYLTTKGWKTGKEHRIEIWFVSYDDKYYVIILVYIGYNDGCNGLVVSGRHMEAYLSGYIAGAQVCNPGGSGCTDKALSK